MNIVFDNIIKVFQGSLLTIKNRLPCGYKVHLQESFDYMELSEYIKELLLNSKVNMNNIKVIIENNKSLDITDAELEYNYQIRLSLFRKTCILDIIHVKEWSDINIYSLLYSLIDWEPAHKYFKIYFHNMKDAEYVINNTIKKKKGIL